mmetsp:Transcript_20691/g.33702  ORF Transcript_20691/g.33702 Transcript_20691/m.33702 type:complete len:114 (-) Transcript_20691:1593-1934(-)
MSSGAGGEEELRAKLGKYAEEAQYVRQHLAQMEAQEREHIVALEVLKGLSKERKCYRLVGDVLVERSVDEALESVQGNMEMIVKTMETNVKRCSDIEQEITKLANVINAGQAK